MAAKTVTTLRIRPTDRQKQELRRKAKEHGLTLNGYLTAVIEAGVRRRFTVPRLPQEERSDTRLRLDPQLKSEIRALAKQTGATPEDWVLAVVDLNDTLFDE